MQTESRIEATVMRRVRRARMVRPFVSVAPAVALFALALYGIGREVWVARVMENMPSDAYSIVGFFMQAFLTTELVVQVLILMLALAAVWFAREIARTLPAPSLRAA